MSNSTCRPRTERVSRERIRQILSSRFRVCLENEPKIIAKSFYSRICCQAQKGSYLLSPMDALPRHQHLPAQWTKEERACQQPASRLPRSFLFQKLPSLLSPITLCLHAPSHISHFPTILSNGPGGPTHPGIGSKRIILTYAGIEPAIS